MAQLISVITSRAKRTISGLHDDLIHRPPGIDSRITYCTWVIQKPGEESATMHHPHQEVRAITHLRADRVRDLQADKASGNNRRDRKSVTDRTVTTRCRTSGRDRNNWRKHERTTVPA